MVSVWVDHCARVLGVNDKRHLLLPWLAVSSAAPLMSSASHVEKCFFISIYERTWLACGNYSYVDELSFRICFFRQVVFGRQVAHSRRKDWAIVNFTTRDAAQTCIKEMHGTEFLGV